MQGQKDVIAHKNNHFVGDSKYVAYVIVALFGKVREKKNFIDFALHTYNTMPKIRTTRTKRAPEGFDEIEPTLEEFSRKMKEGMYFYARFDD